MGNITPVHGRDGEYKHHCAGDAADDTRARGDGLSQGKGLLKQAIKHLGRQQDGDNLSDPSPPRERLGARCWVHDLEQRIVHQIDGE